jgi:hypothetical protein
MLPVLLASDSVPNALVGVLVPFSLPPQLLRERLPSSKAARGKEEVECRMETKVKVEALVLPRYTVTNGLC